MSFSTRWDCITDTRESLREDDLVFMMGTLQMFVSIHSHFNLERDLYNRELFKSNRAVALNEWRRLAG
jgi:hypothetical protein